MYNPILFKLNLESIPKSHVLFLTFLFLNRNNNKPNSPLKDETSLEIIALPIRILVVPFEVTIVELVNDNTKLVRRNIEPIDILISSSRIEPFEFLSINLPLTPPQISVRLKINLISNTPHALEVSIMPIVTFDETLN
jgi:hypothetical protein